MGAQPAVRYYSSDYEVLSQTRLSSVNCNAVSIPPEKRFLPVFSRIRCSEPDMLQQNQVARHSNVKNKADGTQAMDLALGPSYGAYIPTGKNQRGQSMVKPFIVAVAAGLALVGCKTTEQAARSVRAKWIGQPVDQFFVENGPPVSEFPLTTGGTIYTWRGGEMNYVRPAQYQTQPAFSSAPMRVSEKTTTVTSRPSPGVTVTQSKTTSSSFGFSAPQVTTMVRPPQQVHLVCEAQITADENGKIVAVRINRDTEGAAFSLSRCSEIFGD